MAAEEGAAGDVEGYGPQRSVAQSMVPLPASEEMQIPQVLSVAVGDAAVVSTDGTLGSPAAVGASEGLALPRHNTVAEPSQMNSTEQSVGNLPTAGTPEIIGGTSSAQLSSGGTAPDHQQARAFVSNFDNRVRLSGRARPCFGVCLYQVYNICARMFAGRARPYVKRFHVGYFPGWSRIATIK